jgi:hypothetical protein
MFIVFQLHHELVPKEPWRQARFVFISDKAIKALFCYLLKRQVNAN